MMNNKFELEHIGINTNNADQAADLAKLLSMMFNLSPATARSPSSPVLILNA